MIRGGVRRGPVGGVLGRALWLAVVVMGCETGDIGTPCPEMDLGGEQPTSPADGNADDGSVVSVRGNEAVEYNVEFPCTSAICVATLGRQPYCSRECDDKMQCPDGFSCRRVMAMGPLAGRTYCAWKECDNHGDCGDPWSLACTRVLEESLADEVRVCSWRGDVDDFGL